MIVITTPTGLIDGQVLSRVLEGDQPVRVIVRDAARLPAGIRDRVEVVEGSHGDPATRPAADAISRQGVRRVVTVSALGRGSSLDSGYVGASLRMEDLLASTGVALRALTMPSFMDNMVNQVGALQGQGMFFSTVSADRKDPTVATRDIAAVAAGLLLDGSWTGQDSVPVLGPEDLSNNDLARILTDVLGTPRASSRSPARRSGPGSPASACPTRWPRAWST